MENKSLVWLLDDDAGFLQNLEMAMSVHFEVASFTNANDLLAAITENKSSPRLLVSDHQLAPDYTLVDLLQESTMKEFAGQTEILVLSGTPGEEVITDLLELGVVDFISKPVNIHELVVKCKRIAQQKKSEDGKSHFHSEISTDPALRQVFLNGQLVEELTGKQYQIFVAILRSGEKGITKQDLNEAVWSGKAVDPRALSVHLAGLRKRFKETSIKVNFDKKAEVYRIETGLQDTGGELEAS